MRSSKKILVDGSIHPDSKERDDEEGAGWAGESAELG